MRKAKQIAATLIKKRNDVIESLPKKKIFLNSLEPEEDKQSVVNAGIVATVMTQATNEELENLLKEIKKMAKDRKLTDDDNWMPLFRQQKSKWIAVARIINQTFKHKILDPQMFERYVKNKFPELKNHKI